MYTAFEVEKMLGISEPTRQRLAKMGLLVPRKVGREQRYSAPEVLKWVNAAEAPRESALVVRMGMPGADKDGRKIGWLGPLMSDEKSASSGVERYTSEEQRDAVRKWWRIADPEALIGLPLVAAVSDWAVGAWRIIGANRNEWGYVEFEVTTDVAIKDRWVISRLNLPRGPVGAIRWPRPN